MVGKKRPTIEAKIEKQSSVHKRCTSTPPFAHCALCHIATISSLQKGVIRFRRHSLRAVKWKSVQGIFYGVFTSAYLTTPFSAPWSLQRLPIVCERRLFSLFRNFLIGTNVELRKLINEPRSGTYLFLACNLCSLLRNANLWLAFKMAGYSSRVSGRYVRMKDGAKN